MTETQQTMSRTPWHLWAVGALALLWNGYGAYDYVMTQTGGAEYLRSFGFTEAQIAYYAAMPMWATAAWAVGVWGGAAGGMLLLLRSKWALHAFLASLTGFVFGLVYTYALSSGAEIAGPEAAVMNVVIGAGCLFFAWYAWQAGKRGLLG
jgi:hypothetical protein